MSIFGIDVSKYQGPINWPMVKQAGVKFRMIRGAYRGWGDGTIHRDRRADEYVTGCMSTGIHYGIYIFSQAINEAEAVREADYIIDWLIRSGFTPDYPVCIDQEYSGDTQYRGRADHLTAEQYARNRAAFCARCEERGYYALIYCSEAWYKQYHARYSSFLDKYDYWIAKWSEVAPNISRHFGMWQYSNLGTVSGISGRLDLDVAYKDYSGIIKRSGLNGWGTIPRPAGKSLLMRILEIIIRFFKGTL